MEEFILFFCDILSVLVLLGCVCKKKKKLEGKKSEGEEFLLWINTSNHANKKKEKKSEYRK